MPGLATARDLLSRPAGARALVAVAERALHSLGPDSAAPVLSCVDTAGVNDTVQQRGSTRLGECSSSGASCCGGGTGRGAGVVTPAAQAVGPSRAWDCCAAHSTSSTHSSLPQQQQRSLNHNHPSKQVQQQHLQQHLQQQAPRQQTLPPLAPLALTHTRPCTQHSVHRHSLHTHQHPWAPHPQQHTTTSTRVAAHLLPRRQLHWGPPSLHPGGDPPQPHQEQQQQQGQGQAQAVAAAELLVPLLEGRPFVVQQVSGRGRGLVASRRIAAGEAVHAERPMLCLPAQEAMRQVCYHCLGLLGPDTVLHRATGRRFCGDACMASALTSYLAVEAAARLAPPPTAAAAAAGAGSGSGGGEAAAAAGTAAKAAGGGGGGTAAGGGGSSSSGEGGGGLRPLDELDQQCAEYGERFPLITARLLYMHVTEAVRRTLAARGLDPLVPEPPARRAVAAGGAGGGAAEGELEARAGDPLGSMHVLCYANVPKPYPEVWVAQHALLTSAVGHIAGQPSLLRYLASTILLPPRARGVNAASLEAAARAADTGVLEEPPAAGPGGGRGGSGGGRRVRDDELAAAVRAVVEGLGVDWFVAVMARLHLNVFQVHNPLAGANPSDLAAAAAALVSGTAGGGSSGSAVYLLASMCNHSCEPNLDLSYVYADGTAVLTAAREIEAGEELTVSYLDVGLPYDARQRHLQWSYGFACGCARCVEEGAEAQGRPAA